MTVLDPGHTYELMALDGGAPAILRHVKRMGPGYPGNESEYPGTTTQEVLRAEVDRLMYLDRQQHHPVNQRSVVLLMEVIGMLEARAAEIHGRMAPPICEAVYGTPCAACGHTGCTGGCRR